MPRSTIRYEGNAVTSSPAKLIFPCCGCNTPAIIFTVVDLPAPLAPKRAMAEAKIPNLQKRPLACGRFNPLHDVAPALLSIGLSRGPTDRSRGLPK